ncbi:MAG: DNA-binding transcriptional regulator [Kiritimatiellae bacterium]|nr:DNA-binding transcriptional regulator [Kiritimatiellia bacterium]
MKSKTVPRVLLASTWQSYELASGVVRYAAEAGWHLDMTFFISSELPRKWEGEGILALLGERPALTRLVRSSHCPVVSLTSNRHGLDIPYVDVDNERVGVLAAEHFLCRNFQHFAYYASTEWPVDRLRYDGFARRLAREVSTCTYLSWQKQRGQRKDTWENRQQWLKRVLRRMPKPLAIFTVDDLHAVELIEASIQLSLRIPEELAVLGVGDHKLLSNTTSVPLSSISINESNIGYQAASLLQRCMNGEMPSQPYFKVEPSEVIGRRSTETIATDNTEIAKALRFMMEHYRAPVGISDIVAATALSQTNLYRVFHVEFGESPIRFLTRFRLEKAKRLLADRTNKLASVSRECGFGDVVNLFRVFKRIEGLSPKQYRAVTWQKMSAMGTETIKHKRKR